MLVKGDFLYNIYIRERETGDNKNIYLQHFFLEFCVKLWETLQRCRLCVSQGGHDPWSSNSRNRAMASTIDIAHH